MRNSLGVLLAPRRRTKCGATPNAAPQGRLLRAPRLGQVEWCRSERSEEPKTPLRLPQWGISPRTPQPAKPRVVRRLTPGSRHNGAGLRFLATLGMTPHRRPLDSCFRRNDGWGWWRRQPRFTPISIFPHQGGRGFGGPPPLDSCLRRNGDGEARGGGRFLSTASCTVHRHSGVGRNPGRLVGKTLDSCFRRNDGHRTPFGAAVSSACGGRGRLP